MGSLGSLDLSALLKEMMEMRSQLQSEGEKTGQQVGDSIEDGINDSLRKIKISSSALESAFGNINKTISQKTKQLKSTIGKENIELRVGFSDVNLQSKAINSRVSNYMSQFSKQKLVEFDSSDAEAQFKNLITLYVKYEEKLRNLKNNFNHLSGDGAVKNLKEQYLVANQLKGIYEFLSSQTNTKIPLESHSAALKNVVDNLFLIRKFDGVHSGAVQQVTEFVQAVSSLGKELSGSEDNIKKYNELLEQVSSGSLSAKDATDQLNASISANLDPNKDLKQQVSYDKDIKNILSSYNIEVSEQVSGAFESLLSAIKEVYDGKTELSDAKVQSTIDEVSNILTNQGYIKKDKVKNPAWGLQSYLNKKNIYIDPGEAASFGGVKNIKQQYGLNLSDQKKVGINYVGLDQIVDDIMRNFPGLDLRKNQISDGKAVEFNGSVSDILQNIVDEIKQSREQFEGKQFTDIIDDRIDPDIAKTEISHIAQNWLQDLAGEARLDFENPSTQKIRLDSQFASQVEQFSLVDENDVDNMQKILGMAEELMDTMRFNDKYTNEELQTNQFVVDTMREEFETAKASQQEAKGFDDVSTAAKGAAKAKGEFTDANKKAKKSADDSTPSIQAEGDALDDIAGDEDGGRNTWTTPRVGISENNSEPLKNDINLPVKFVGENGNDIIDMFAKIRSDIEKQTNNPVTIEFQSAPNAEGELEAVGAKLKYINQESGVTVTQFYDIARGADGIITATQAAEKTVLGTVKATKDINTESQQKEFNNLLATQKEYYSTISKLRNAESGSQDQEYYSARLVELQNALISAKEKTNLTDEQSIKLAQEKQKYEQQLKEQAVNKQTKNQNNQFKEINKLYGGYLKTQENVANYKSAPANKDNSASITNEYKKQLEIKKQLYDLGVNVEEIDHSGVLTQEQKNTLLNQEEQSRKRIAEIAAKATDRTASAEIRANQNYGKSAYNSAQRKYDQVQSSISVLGLDENEKILAQLDIYKAKLKELENVRNEFANGTRSKNNQDDVAKFQRLVKETDNLHQGLKKIVDVSEKLNNLPEDAIFSRQNFDAAKDLKPQLEAVFNQIAKDRGQITGASVDGKELYGTIDRGKGVIEDVTVQLDEGTRSLIAYKTATKNVGSAWEQLKTGVGKKAKEILNYAIGGGSLYAVINQVKKGVGYVKEIDSAMTELKKVTEETDATYNKFLQNASKTAGNIGTTVKDLTNASADFARLGYSLDQASDLAKAASVYKNVGDGISDINTASESIISTMKGFGIEAEDAMGIVDKFNSVGNSFAISSGGIGEALLRSASAMKEAGNTIDESIGLITAANSVVQDPASVGTAMKTLSLRLRGKFVPIYNENYSLCYVT